MAKKTNAILERMKKARTDAPARRRKRRDAELARLGRLRDAAKGPLKEWLTKRLEGRREALERTEKRRIDRKAKRQAKRAKWAARRGKAAPAGETPDTGPLDGMNAGPAIKAIGTMDAATAALARAQEQARTRPRTTVLAAIDERELELAAQ